MDTVSPIAEFLDVALDGATLAISWVAHDKNFGPEPVAIYFANQPGGPWQAIAGKLPATGTYRWELPKGIASRAFLRLEAVDRAANVTRTDLPDPVSLDPSRPKITLRRVTPVEQK